MALTVHGLERERDFLCQGLAFDLAQVPVAGPEDRQHGPAEQPALGVTGRERKLLELVRASEALTDRRFVIGPQVTAALVEHVLSDRADVVHQRRHGEETARDRSDCFAVELDALAQRVPDIALGLRQRTREQDTNGLTANQPQECSAALMVDARTGQAQDHVGRSNGLQTRTGVRGITHGARSAIVV